MVKILLVGIGGYAYTYVNPLLDGVRADCEIVGCVDPYPTSCPRLAEIQARNIPVFADMSAFFDAGLTADLAVITTPIHLHTRQITAALAHGCHVLCEKPLCGDVRDVPALIAARDAAKKNVSIGYQWSHSDAILSLKRDILAGLYGEAVKLKTLVLWPRDFAYYKRGCGWAGKLCAADGSLILDSVANNATAHYLHNMLYVLGDAIDRSAMPESVVASLWRANAIENYDTASIEMTFAGGAKALFIASHATEQTVQPLFDYEFTKGRVVFSEGEGKKLIRGIFADGTEKIYGDPFYQQEKKLWMAADGVLDASARPVCPIEAATPHARVIALAQECGVQSFAPEKITLRADGSGVYVPGLGDELIRAYERGEFWRG